MNLKHLQFFVEVARTEHMAQAAENLGISQPSLSYAIKSIEDELGVALFEKDGRNIKLSVYGKIYLDYVTKSLNDLKTGYDYIAELVNANVGHINLGFTYTMGQELIPHIIREFKNDEANANITFSLKQGVTNDLITELGNDELDLVVASKPTLKVLNTELNSTHLLDQQVLAAVSYENPLAKQKSVTLAELAQYPFVLYSEHSGFRPILNSIFEENMIDPDVVLEADEDHTIIGFVHWNYGVAIVPSLPQLDQSYVKLLPITDENIPHPIYLFTKANHFLTPSVTKFEHFVEKYSREQYFDKKRLI